eukprot:CAMPEP_0172454718 /NCGR_PEP_ID=MMETSP1065-20121228/11623_1 /TAXON_ID=265537 /ORGANISM="Amphiprora paludosa, Strain CCMP125" /LENGTH=450 /DNA_ID=CAMNT_0013207097 /DNA_START=66 /DNA_END=1418 /DNA_ORIENTATION=-
MEGGGEDLDNIMKPDGRTLSVTLGIKDYASPASATPRGSQVGVEEELTATEYDIRPDPASEKVDLSQIRGQTISPENKYPLEDDAETELAALAELLPEVTSKRKPQEEAVEGEAVANNQDVDEGEPATPALVEDQVKSPPPEEEAGDDDSTSAMQKLSSNNVNEMLNRQVSMKVQDSGDQDGSGPDAAADNAVDGGHTYGSNDVNDPPPQDATSFDDYPESENALNDAPEEEAENIPKEFLNSGQSISTATQTHEVRMPMYLPTFKPATGCTNASDFIVRCFVARLRSGITVVKHGRSRWCKSRLRVLQIHPDGRSLTWKPAEGEPTTNRKPPKLDLSTCLEVRHAWSPDPHNPMYTGTPILRQKCEAANAHKSFALIFKHRTVDITAVTADQCKVLMEGFSALCFRLQVASLAGRSGSKNKAARPMPDEDGVSVTASNTLTNTSAPKNR